MSLGITRPEIRSVARHRLELAVDKVGVVLVNDRVGKGVSRDQIPLPRKVCKRIELYAAAPLLAELDGKTGIIRVGRKDVGQIDLIDRGRAGDTTIEGVEFESRSRRRPLLRLEWSPIYVRTGLRLE